MRNSLNYLYIGPMNETYHILKEVTYPIEKASSKMMFFSVSFILFSSGVFYLAYHQLHFELKFLGTPHFLILLILGVLLHEALHAFCFLIFNRFSTKGIKFGFNKQWIAPYAHYRNPLKVNQFVIAALTPLVVLGMGPWVFGLVYGYLGVYILGIIFIIGAGGDILISLEALKYPLNQKIVDHPHTMGFYVVSEL